MMLMRKQRGLLTVFLVLLLVVQVNALPIHEFNLRQQGYTLVQVPASQWSSETPVQSHNGIDYYNIQLCGTHFHINATTQFDKTVVSAALLFGLVVLLGCGYSVTSQRWSTPDLLSSLTRRGPPATPSV